MNKDKFQIIKQYIGINLLNYILNTNEKINDETDFDKYSFVEIQLSVLRDLSQTIQDNRIQFVLDNGRGSDGTSLEYFLTRSKVGEISLFNYYRTLCGGACPESKSDDQVLNFLAALCIREFPTLLLKLMGSTHPSGYGLHFGGDDYKKFSSLIKKDELDALTNHETGLDYAFVFTTQDGISVNIQVEMACGVIISRSFQNACNKMKYSLKDVLEEIKHNLYLLRALAKDQEIEYSSFVGIKGLALKGFDSIDFGKAYLRQINDILNPSYHTSKTAMIHSSEDEKYLSGNVLEIKHSTKMSLQTSCFNGVKNSIIFDQQNKIIDSLKFSVVFSLLEDKGISTSLFENGFPLIAAGNYSYSECQPQKYLTIQPDDLGDIQDWFRHLTKTDLTPINVPLTRLNYAIFERKNPEDAIVDAIIAWEGMFSGASETSFKVTGSIAKYLKNAEKREAFISRLKDIYSFRSNFVHGKKSKKLKKENIDDLRKEVIEIGLDCIKKLLKDDVLLKLDPSERVKQVMVLN